MTPLPDPKNVPEFMDPKEWRKYCQDTRDYYANHNSGHPEEESHRQLLHNQEQGQMVVDSDQSGCLPEGDCEDIFVKISTILCLGSLLCCLVILPPIMVVIGINFFHCDAVFPSWLIVGAVIWYVDLLSFWVHWKANKTMSFKKVEDKRKFFLFIGVAVILIIWYSIGFARIFGPARRAMRGWSTDPGIYDDPMMKDADCHFYMITFNFWLTLLPCIFFGFFILFLCIFACICFCDMNEDD